VDINLIRLIKFRFIYKHIMDILALEQYIIQIQENIKIKNKFQKWLQKKLMKEIMMN
jgi:hypothetical protein